MTNQVNPISIGERNLSCPVSGIVALQQSVDKNPLICTPDTSVRDVLNRMNQGSDSCAAGSEPLEAKAPQRANYVLIMVQQQLLGIFTERDVVKLSAQEIDFDAVQIADVMTRNLITLPASELKDAFNVLSLFRQHHIRHVPILDDQAHVTGVITTEGLRQSLQPSTLMKMRAVHEVMNAQPITASPSTSVMEVAEIMATHQISCVVIVQTDVQDADSILYPIGIITERDIVQYQTLELDLKSLQAQAAMSSPLECLTIEDTLWHAQQFMQKLHVRRLVVTDTAGQLTGVLTQSNMLSVLNGSDMYTTLEILQDQVDQLQNERIQLLQALNSTLEHQVEADAVMLQSCQTHFESTFEQAAVGIAHVSLQGRFRAVNQRFCELLKYSQSELLQLSFLDITHVDDREEDQQLVQQLILSQKSSFSREKRYLCQDFSIFWGKVTVSLATSAPGEPGYFIAVVEDISDRKHTELALQQLNQELEERVKFSTAAFQASEHRYRSLFESAPDLLFVLNKQGVIQQVNMAVLERSGYAEAELLNRSLSQFWVTAPPLTDAQLLQILLKEGHWRYTLEFRCRDGSPLFVDCAYSMITDEIGVSPHILVIQRDISEQTQVKTALIVSEARYRSLYENTPIMLHSIDQDGRMVSVSNTWLTQMGYDRSEVLGRASTDFLTSASQHYARDFVLPQYFQTGACRDIPYQWVKKNGELIDVLLSAIAERDTSGNIIRTLAVSVDVTERNRIEVALSESEERFRLAFEQAAIGMALISPAGQWLKANESLCKIVGYSEAELLSMTFQDITHPDDVALDLKSAEQLLTGEINNYHTEKRYIHKQGHDVWILLSASLVCQDNGLPLHFITQIQNISARKVSEQQLSESLAEKSVMLQEIHHRVKNNLQVICSLLNLQTQANPDTNIAEVMQESQNRVKSMALVHENLYQSKNLSKINLETYVKELTNNLLRSYRSRVSLTQINITIDNIYLDIDTAVPCGLIINELVSNALKHAFPEQSSGIITIHIQEPSNSELTLTVADNGRGMSEQVSFNNTQTLGLRMVKTLTRQISGTITINRDSGTSFQICFQQPAAVPAKSTSA